MFKLKNILITIGLFVASFTMAQKGHPILDDYDVFENSGTVYISVTISSGNTCNGINVQRSDDSLSYQDIGHVEGICGNSSSPITYSFTDENPIKNKKSYYRVELGGNGYTTVISLLLIDTKEFGFQVRPNPSNEKAVIYFENPQQEQFQLELYNLAGAKIGLIQSTSNSFEVNTAELNKGMYFFSISKAIDQEKVIGKLMVQH